VAKKVQLKVYVDPDLLERLWSIIRKKWSERTYGARAAEVSDAIAYWINRHQETLELHTNTHKPINPAFPRVHLICRQIVEAVKKRGFTFQVPASVVEKEIGEIRGSDRRTIRKWLKNLTKYGYMKWIQLRLLEII